MAKETTFGDGHPGHGSPKQTVAGFNAASIHTGFAGHQGEQRRTHEGLAGPLKYKPTPSD